MSQLTIPQPLARFPAPSRIGYLLGPLLLAGTGLWFFFRVLTPLQAAPTLAARSPAPAGPLPALAEAISPTNPFSPYLSLPPVGAALASPLVSAASVPSAPGFTATPFGSGNTQAVGVGDLNDDGALDIVVGRSGAQSVAYLNDGAGNYPSGAVDCSNTHERCFGPVVTDTRSVAVGDVNGDGALDIIAGDFAGQNVAYLNSNDGQATFLTGAVDCTTPNPQLRCFGTGTDNTQSVAAGDVNGDGALDIVVGNSGEQSLVYLNNGSGDFSTSRNFGSATDDTRSVTLGDMNDDGMLDIVVGNFDGQSLIYLNDREGNFSTSAVDCANPPALPPTYRCFGPGSDKTQSVAVGDVNGDGVLDVVAGNDGQDVVYLGSGAILTFSLPITFNPVADNTSSVTLGDLNGDGALDIAVSNSGAQSRVYLNDSSGGFSATSDFGPPTEDTRSVALADLNGDGALDVIAGNYANPSVVYRNNGAGDFPAARNFGPFSASTYGVAVGDFNGDGALDVVAGNYFNQSAVYLNDGTGNFYNDPVNCAVPNVKCFGLATDATAGIAIGDMNGDGALDLVVGESYQSNKVFLNDGLGNFTDVHTFGTGLEGTFRLALGDMNGDGALDIVIGNFNGQNAVYLNDGQGNFYAGPLNCASPPNSVICFGTGADSTVNIALGDVNGDGNMDIVAGKRGQDVVYLNNGAGNFTQEYNFGPTASSTYGLGLGDVNGDGHLDIVAGNFNGQQNVVYLNDGAGNFPPTLERNFGTGTDTTALVALGDVNGDKAPDIVVGNFGQSAAYLNDGAGNFYSGPVDCTALPSRVRCFGPGTDNSTSVTLGDMNGDGAPDPVLGNISGQSAFYLNGLSGFGRLANNPPRVALTRPNPLMNVGAVIDPLGFPSVPFSYTLFDPEGQSARVIRGYFSENGGGVWQSAIATTATLTTNVPALGRALAFDGSNDYVDLGNPLTMNIVDTITLEAWVKFETTAGIQNIIAHGLPNKEVHLRISNGQYQAGAWDNGDALVSYPIPAGDVGQWVHLAGVYDGDAWHLYRNGVEVKATSALTGAVTVTENWAIGASGTSQPSNLQRLFKGEIDEVRVWDAARTPAQILAYMTQTIPSNASGLVGYWRFNEGQGITAYDQTSNHYNGTLTNGPAWTDVAFPHVYYWDSTASQFSGESANLVFRLEAYSPLTPTVNGLSGPYQRPYLSAQTFSFRDVRFGQPRVLSGSVPVEGALVYQLAPRDTFAHPLIDRGRLLTTDSQGYLHKSVNAGDRLVALLPIPLISPVVPNNGDLVFDGVDDSVSLSRLIQDDFTIEFWFKSTQRKSTGSGFGNLRWVDGMGLVDGSVGGAANDFGVSLGDGMVLFGTGNPTTTLQSQSVADGEWHHVAATRSETSGALALYLDGVLVATGTGSTQSLTSPPALRIGSLQTNANFFEGAIDEVRLWTTARTTDTIQADMWRTLTGHEQDLVGYWRFNESAGKTAFDQTPNHNDGALNGDPAWDAPYQLYFTSAAPTEAGLNMYTVTSPIQLDPLVVSPDNPLILFNLTVSLEWNASQDLDYLLQLEHNFETASTILYDVTDGQAAIGKVTIYQNRARWNDANIRIYATNQLRPYATQGGLISEPLTDTATLGAPSPVVYVPGQLAIGAIWNRFGDPSEANTSDWPSTLAHELGHYLFFQDDDYLGLNQQGFLKSVRTCTGTIMSDSYNPDWSEFHPQAEWIAVGDNETDRRCGDTLANITQAGRSDWDIVTQFYPELTAPGPRTAVPKPPNPGPKSLPLAVTQVEFVTSNLTTPPLDIQRFDLIQDGNRVEAGNHAQGYLFRGNELIQLGRPVVSQIHARGVLPNDRLCVFDSDFDRQGCKVVTEDDNHELRLYAFADWRPDVLITPEIITGTGAVVTTHTVTVVVSNLPLTYTLWARIYDNTGFASTAISMPLRAGNVYTGMFDLTSQVSGTLVQASVDITTTEGLEIVATYSVGGNPGDQKPKFGDQKPKFGDQKPKFGDQKPRFGDQRPKFGDQRPKFAPVLSGDGRAILYAQDLQFDPGTFYVLQTATFLPDVPLWETVVGKGYHLLVSPHAPQLSGTTISIGYAKSEVPIGAEPWLRVYFRSTTDTVWHALSPSEVNTQDNYVTAPAQGPGLYVLMTAIELPLQGSGQQGEGWDLFAYPVPGALTVTDALLSIQDDYRTVYWYNTNDKGGDPWKLYSPEALDWVNDLMQLQFGESYWIYLKRPVTLKLKGQTPSTLSAATAGSQSPPATFYGSVTAASGISVTSGTTVMALIDNQQCGQGKTLTDTTDTTGKLMNYAVNVYADGPGAVGCGGPEQIVKFRIGPVEAMQTGVWSNTVPISLNLLLPARVYLPVMLRDSRASCSGYASTDVPKIIPDKYLPGVTSTLIVPASNGITIGDVTLNLDRLIHPYDGDLQITLIAPDGTAVLVVDSEGKDGDNFIGTRLSDRFSALLSDAGSTSPFTGDFKPDRPLSAMRGHNSAGTWTLKVVDRAVGDVGTLEAWSLQICSSVNP